MWHGVHLVGRSIHGFKEKGWRWVARSLMGWVDFARGGVQWIHEEWIVWSMLDWVHANRRRRIHWAEEGGVVVHRLGRSHGIRVWERLHWGLGNLLNSTDLKGIWRTDV